MSISEKHRKMLIVAGVALNWSNLLIGGPVGTILHSASWGVLLFAGWVTLVKCKQILDGNDDPRDEDDDR
jgi:hypothetical protein